MEQDKQFEFLESEHFGNFHNKVQAGCYECARERRLIQAKKSIDAIGKGHKEVELDFYPPFWEEPQ